MRTVSVALVADVSRYTANIGKTAVNATRQLNSEVSKLGKNHKDEFNRLVLGAGGLGAALVAPFAIAVKKAADFDHEMAAVVAVTDETGRTAREAAKDQADLRAAALQAGKATVFSATQAAQAVEELAKAGVSTTDVLAGGLKGALSLASAGSIGLADAATDAAQAMNIFGLNGAAVPHIADVLAGAANKSAADVSTMALAMNQSGLVAHQLGLSLEDTAGALALFAQNGLNGSDAGTSFKTMLQALENPSAQTAGLMKRLGISIYDAHGQFVGITGVADVLQKKLGGLTAAERNFALAQIFGSDGVRAATVLYKAGASGLQDWIDGVNQSGAAAETARKKLDNLAGDVEQLRGSVETLAISAGSGANKGLRTLAQAATSTVNAFLAAPAPLQETATVLTGVAGGSLLAAAGLLKVKQVAADTIDALAKTGPAGQKAASGISALGKYGAVAGIATAATLALIAGEKKLIDVASRGSQPLARNIDALTDSLSRFANTGRTTGELLKLTGGDLDTWSQHFAKIANADYWATLSRDASKEQDLDKQVKQLTIDSKALDTSMAELVKNGQVTQARIVFDDLTQALRSQGYSVDAINKLFPQYVNAAAGAAASNTGLAKGFGNAAQNAQTLDENMKDLIDRGETFDTVWQQLNGSLAGTDKAMLDANKTVDELKKSLKDNKDAIDGNTSAALADRVAVAAVAEAAAKAADAKLKETGSVTDANKVYDDYIGQLRKTLGQAGLTKGQIDKLIAAYASMPPTISTTVHVPGLDDATEKVKSFSKKLDNINGRIVDTYIVVNTTTGKTSKIVHPGTAFNRYGGVYTPAEDGALRDADVYRSASSGARYAFAEPATGGEAFIPRKGDLDRSRAIAGYVVSNWLGGRVNWPGNAAGSTQVTYNLYSSDADAGRQLQHAARLEEVRHRIGRAR